MATVVEGFMEKVCLAPHSLSIMLEMPGEATYSLEGMYLRRKTWSCHWWVSIWQLWERGLILPLSAMSSRHSGTQPGPRSPTALWWKSKPAQLRTVWVMPWEGDDLLFEHIMSVAHSFHTVHQQSYSCPIYLLRILLSCPEFIRGANIPEQRVHHNLLFHPFY